MGEHWKTLQIWENVGTHGKTRENIGKHVNTWENIGNKGKHGRTLENREN